MTKVRQAAAEWGPELSQHKSLSLFDVNRNSKRRVHFHRSRIPVLTRNRTKQSGISRLPSSLLGANAKECHTRLVLKREESRIPVYRNAVAQLRKQKKISTILEQETSPTSNKPVSFASSDNSNENLPTVVIANQLKRLKMSHVRTKAAISADRKPTQKKVVKLRGLELSSLSGDIFQQTDIETLIMSPEREACLSHKLAAIPKQVSNLRNLRTLVVDTNELQAIPEEISLLTSLEAIALSNNFLTELPENFGQLEKLTSLHLANNRFQGIPTSVCRLKSLTFLDMSDNEIFRVPKEISNLSVSLQSLLLFMNDIESLPDEISQLTALTCLWLGANKLKELPKNFGNLRHLDWGIRPCSSNIDGNPLVRPPTEICNGGPYAIQKYFEGNKKTKNHKTVRLKPVMARRNTPLISGW